jgi:hypothetical protein
VRSGGRRQRRGGRIARSSRAAHPRRPTRPRSRLQMAGGLSLNSVRHRSAASDGIVPQHHLAERHLDHDAGLDPHDAALAVGAGAADAPESLKTRAARILESAKMLSLGAQRLAGAKLAEQAASSSTPPLTRTSARSDSRTLDK